jgi:small subunit ribosomal protein S9
MISQKEDHRHYYEGVGRRKTSRARVRIWEAGLPAQAGKRAVPTGPLRRSFSEASRQASNVSVNARLLSAYFPILQLQQIVMQPLEKLGLSGIKVEARVSGGGIHSQAEAVRHGVARALVKKEAALKPLLKAHGFLTRDARAKERRKFGLKKARRAPQWSKR